MNTMAGTASRLASRSRWRTRADHLRDKCLNRQFLMRLLHEHKGTVVPGTSFDPAGEGHVRCSFATGLDQIKTAMERLAAFFGR